MENSVLKLENNRASDRSKYLSELNERLAVERAVYQRAEAEKLHYELYGSEDQDEPNNNRCPTFEKGVEGCGAQNEHKKNDFKKVQGSQGSSQIPSGKIDPKRDETSGEEDATCSEPNH